MKTRNYVLGNLSSEIERLELQARLFSSVSMQVLMEAGLRAGMRCLDVGCGSGSVTRALAEAVGSKGYVKAIDIDERYLEYCRHFDGYDNVEFARDDISNTGMTEDSKYDIVFSRFLFVHLADKVSAIKAMAKMLKKGGKMVIQELDHSTGSWLCYPNDKHVESLRKAYVSLLKRTGGDPLAGRKLYGLMSQESLRCEVSCFSPCIPMGYAPMNSLGWRILDSLKPQLTKRKILTRKEIEEIRGGLHSLAKRRGSFVAYARLFSVVGTK